jgi:hypothetical protein
LRQIAASIDAPQFRQATSAVFDIRAIVECAPQSGNLT